MCAQPCIPYYTWQVEVVIRNFIKNGINPNTLDVVGTVPADGNIPDVWRKMADHYNYVRVFRSSPESVEAPVFMRLAARDGWRWPSGP
jgi:hypothetical protein